MRRLAGSLVLAALCGSAAVMHGQGPIATLTCTGGSGGSFSSNVFYVEAEQFYSEGAETTTGAEVGLDISSFGPLSSAVVDETAYLSCVVAGGGISVTFNNALFQSVYAEGSSAYLSGFYGLGFLGLGESGLYFATTPQAYAIGALTYGSVTVGSSGPQKKNQSLSSALAEMNTKLHAGSTGVLAGGAQ